MRLRAVWGVSLSWVVAVALRGCLAGDAEAVCDLLPRLACGALPGHGVGYGVFQGVAQGDEVGQLGFVAVCDAAGGGADHAAEHLQVFVGFDGHGDHAWQ